MDWQDSKIPITVQNDAAHTFVAGVFVADAFVASVFVASVFAAGAFAASTFASGVFAASVWATKIPAAKTPAKTKYDDIKIVSSFWTTIGIKTSKFVKNVQIYWKEIFTAVNF